jgi:putative transposase
MCLAQVGVTMPGGLVCVQAEPAPNHKLPAEFDASIYRERNKIERFLGRLKAFFRRVATRCQKTSRNFLSMIKRTSVRFWIEIHELAA